MLTLTSVLKFSRQTRWKRLEKSNAIGNRFTGNFIFSSTEVNRVYTILYGPYNKYGPYNIRLIFTSTRFILHKLYSVPF